MGDKKIYIIAKIFEQQGCIAYLCKTINEARCLPGTLEVLRAEAVQIVILDEPEHSGQNWNMVTDIIRAEKCNSKRLSVWTLYRM